MKNLDREEKPLLQLDRSPVLLGIFTVSSLLLAYFTYALFENFSPWGFMILVPAGFVSFQTLWFILNPFVLLFEDKLEVKYSLFKNKKLYFIDIKKFSQSKSGKFYITYKDDELELISLFGIKKEQIPILTEEITKKIGTSV